MASLHEMQTVYGIADVYTMIEVVLIDAHNQREVAKQQGS